jgi:hypothetical protein
VNKPKIIFIELTEICCCQLHFHPPGVCVGWDRGRCPPPHTNLYSYYLAKAL